MIAMTTSSSTSVNAQRPLDQEFMTGSPNDVPCGERIYGGCPPTTLPARSIACQARICCCCVFLPPLKSLPLRLLRPRLPPLPPRAARLVHHFGECAPTSSFPQPRQL